MKKLLRIFSAFIFSSIVFLMFLAGSGIIRVKGAEIGPGMEALVLREYVDTSLGRLSVQGHDENDRLVYAPAAPDADVDLGIVITDVDPDPVTAGTSVTYTVVVINNGPSEATNVEVINDFPNSHFKIPDPPNPDNPEFCDFSPSIVMCTIDNMIVDEPITFTLNLDVKSSATDQLQNTISISSSDTDLVDGNDSATVTTTIEYEYDLAVIKIDNVDLVAPGGTLIYDVTVNHTDGPSDAFDVRLADTLPSELNLVSITPSQGTCDESTMECDLGPLGVSTSANVTLVTTVIQSTPLGTIITNEAEVSSPDDSVLANNTSIVTTTIEAPNQAVLSITKSDSPDPVEPGGELSYIIDITNIGQSDAMSVTITDTLPSEVNFVSITPSQGTCDDNTLVCELGTIITGTTNTASVTLETIVSQSTPLGTIITNTAEVSWLDDTLPYSDSITTTTTVNADVDLSVSKSAPSSVIAGTDLLYLITVSNTLSLYDAPNVRVIDTLPAGVTFDPSPPTSPECTQDSGLVTCNLGTLSAGSSTDVTINVTVDSDASGTLTNIVDVSSDATDPTNNQTSVDTSITYSSDLSVTKIDEPDPVFPGETLTYVLTIENNGPSDASDVVITDTIPTEVSLQSITPSQGSCAGSICELGLIATGSNANVTLVTVVDLNASGDITNSAQVSEAFDPDTSNNQATEDTVIVDSADLTVSTTHTPEPANPGEILTYTLTITNNGPLDALNVVLTDNLPEEVSFISSIPDSPDCDHVLGVVVCDLGSINQGDSTQVVLITQIANDAWGTITNTAMVSSDLNDPDELNNHDLGYTTIGEGANLSLSKTGSPDPVITGGILTYTLTISNGGPLTATNVLLQDVLPGNVSFLSSLPASPTCAESDGVVNCTLGNLYSGETNDVSIIVRVSSSSIEPLINQATVSSVTYDQDEVNNTASDTSEVIDVEAPTVEWISPVGDDQRYDVRGEIILLEVEAIDNVAIERVDFLWWDHEYNNFEGRWVDIGSVFVTPFSIEFDTSILYDGYNQVYARAYDTTGNISNRPRILLFRVEYGYRQYLPVISR